MSEGGHGGGPGGRTVVLFKERCMPYGKAASQYEDPYIWAQIGAVFFLLIKGDVAMVQVTYCSRRGARKLRIGVGAATIHPPPLCSRGMQAG